MTLFSKIFLLSIILNLSVKGIAQETDTSKTLKLRLFNTFDRIFGDDHEPGKPKFLVYPTVGYAPETSLEIGLSWLLLFYAKNDYEQNRLSEINLFSFFTLNRQYGLWFDHAVYGDQDKWFFLGKLRFQRFPLLYFGIGPETEGDNPILIDARYQLIRERVLRKIRQDLFIGLEFDFQRLHQPEFERAPLPDPIGSTGSTNFGLGIGLVYDNRHNVLNTREGLFAEIAWLNYHPSLGSDFSFQAVYWDTRWFYPVTKDKKQILAIQGIGTFIKGEVPFNQMALLGGEQMMRGYYTGRYRDKNYVAAQAEYRFLPFPFSKRLGAAGWLSGGIVAPEVKGLSIRNFVPAGGLGIRYLLFPQKDIFVRLDFGLTAEGPGIYFFTGEAF